jgi:Asp-tRNA(Asn)/Glu-tRNA(Gln) amidotransferase C subunit
LTPLPFFYLIQLAETKDKAFKKNETEKVQQQVRQVIDFFNDLMHLIEHGYITREHVVQAYKVSLQDCADHLLTWWVDGFREENGENWYYISFKKICEER